MKIDLTIDPEKRQRAVERAREKHIIIPTFAELRDPQRNGGRDGQALVEHIIHDAEAHAFITWGFAPGGGREPAPGSMQAHLDDMLLWTSVGMPCPEGAQP